MSKKDRNSAAGGRRDKKSEDVTLNKIFKKTAKNLRQESV